MARARPEDVIVGLKLRALADKKQGKKRRKRTENKQFLSLQDGQQFVYGGTLNVPYLQ
jgi:hypothetical protein